MHVHRQGSLIQMCLRHGWRLMLVQNKEPKSKRVRPRSQEESACTQTRNRNPNGFDTQCWILMRVRRQGTKIQTCLNTCCRLMLVSQPDITNQRDGDRRMSAGEQMDARFEKYNTTFHATRAFVRCQAPWDHHHEHHPQPSRTQSLAMTECRVECDGCSGPRSECLHQRSVQCLKDNGVQRRPSLLSQCQQPCRTESQEPHRTGLGDC